MTSFLQLDGYTRRKNKFKMIGEFEVRVLPTMENMLADINQVRKNELILFLFVSFGSVDASEFFSRPFP